MSPLAREIQRISKLLSDLLRRSNCEHSISPYLCVNPRTDFRAGLKPPTSTDYKQPTTMPSRQRLFATLLGAAQCFIGAVSVITPVWTAVTIFALPAERVVPICTRVSGSRDLVLGAILLWSVAVGHERHSFLAALTTGINLIDVGSAVACGIEGSLTTDHARQVATASGVNVILGALAAL